MNSGAPLLLAKLHRSHARGWASTDAYLVHKDSRRREGARVILNTLGGDTPRQRSANARAISALRPRLKNQVEHWSLSARSGLNLDDGQWQLAAQSWMTAMGAEGHAALVVRHDDSESGHIHVHILLHRVRASDGCVLSDSNQTWRSHKAARSSEAALGLQARPETEPEAMARRRRARKTDASERARRRAERKGHVGPSPQLLLDAIKAGLADRAIMTWPQLIRALEARGVESRLTARADGSVAGWAVRRAGTAEWLKASNLNRAVSATRIQSFLQQRQQAAQRPAVTAPAATAATRTIGVAPAPFLGRDVLAARRDGPLTFIHVQAALEGVGATSISPTSRHGAATRLLFELRRQAAAATLRDRVRRLAVAMLKRAIRLPRARDAIAADAARTDRLATRLTELRERLQVAHVAAGDAAVRARLVQQQMRVERACEFVASARHYLALEDQARAELDRHRQFQLLRAPSARERMR